MLIFIGVVTAQPLYITIPFVLLPKLIDKGRQMCDCDITSFRTNGKTVYKLAMARRFRHWSWDMEDDPEWIEFNVRY